MKKALLFVLVVLMGASTPMLAQTSADDYLPLVNEGVTWKGDMNSRHIYNQIVKQFSIPFNSNNNF